MLRLDSAALQPQEGFLPSDTADTDCSAPARGGPSLPNVLGMPTRLLHGAQAQALPCTLRELPTQGIQVLRVRPVSEP